MRGRFQEQPPGVPVFPLSSQVFTLNTKKTDPQNTGCALGWLGNSKQIRILWNSTRIASIHLNIKLPDDRIIDERWMLLGLVVNLEHSDMFWNGFSAICRDSLNVRNLQQTSHSKLKTCCQLHSLFGALSVFNIIIIPVSQQSGEKNTVTLPLWYDPT